MPIFEHGYLILYSLSRLGVEFVFGVPGGSIEPFYNALARSERTGGPKAILARHETGAAFMADGFRALRIVKKCSGELTRKYSFFGTWKVGCAMTAPMKNGPKLYSQ